MAQDSGRRSAAGQFDPLPPVDPAGGEPLFIGVPDDWMYVSPARAASPYELRHDPQDLAPPDASGRGGYVNAETGLGGRLRGRTGVLPRYKTGDERIRITGMPTEQIARLQQGLARAGLIGKNDDVHTGLADENTVEAYRKLLGYANLWGVTEDVALDRLLQAPIEGADKPRRHTSTTFNYTDPGAAQELVRRTLREQAGMEPTQAEYQQFVGTLRGAEQANPSTTVTTEDAEGNTTSTTTGGDTDPSALASNFVMEERGDDINAYRTLGYYQAALQAIGPGGGMIGGS